MFIVKIRVAMSNVENIEIDLVHYDGGKDFQVQSEYVDETNMNIHVRRIDSASETSGWSEDLDVFFHDGKGHTRVLKVGSSPDNRTKVVRGVELPGCVMQKAEDRTIAERWYPCYQPFNRYEHYPQYVDLNTFNKMFGSDIAVLPGSIYALGMHNGGAFICHDSYGQHDWRYEISMTIDFIWNVAFRMGKKPPTFYCLLCALDGYIEQIYPEKRVVARRVGEIEHRRETHVVVKKLRPDEYPVFHRQKYVMAQSARSSLPHVIPVIDRYCLHHNRYNLYRSVHRGVPFCTKIPKVVYAGGERGSRFNFLHNREITISPRKYFASDAVGKERVTAPEKMPRDEMILYKYIMDIDGNASTWDATAWKLNSGSVIFKTETDWRQWFYDEYLPDVHFICVKDDFSDLQEKIDWCEKNQDKCEDMIARCKDLFQKIYRHENIVQYMQNVIHLLEAEQSAQVSGASSSEN